MILRRNAHTEQHDQRDHDSGAVSVYAALLVPVLAVVLMFFVNAACRWNSWRDASAAADAAARAGVEWSPAEFTDGHITISPALAQQRANGVLSASGYRGTVSVSGSNPPVVSVTVTATVDYVFVGGIGLKPTVDGHGEAQATSGVGG